MDYNIIFEIFGIFVAGCSAFVAAHPPTDPNSVYGKIVQAVSFLSIFNAKTK